MQNLKELIQSIEQEIQTQKINNALDLLTAFDRYQGKDWREYFPSTQPEEKYRILHQDEDFKLVLIYWPIARTSSKHGHMKGGGLMRVLSGSLKETRFHPEDTEYTLGTYTYETGDLSYIHDALALHTVKNTEEAPAVSLHLYCKGIGSTFGVYDKKLGRTG